MQICYALPTNRAVQHHADIAVRHLSNGLNDSTASYKFFWFWALLQLHAERCAQRDAKLQSAKQSQYSAQPLTTVSLPTTRDGHNAQTGIVAALLQEPIYFYQMAAKMIALAWYPYNVFKLHYGATDQINKIIEQLLASPELFTKLKLDPIRSDSTEEDVYNALSTAAKREPKIRRLLCDALLTYVPTRFLAPWFPDVTDKAYKSRKDSEIRNRSTQDPLCLYQIKKGPEGYMLEVNAVWSDYLLEHQSILTDFVLLGLVGYLEKRNPTVPNIINKLQHPMQREPLTYAKQYFDTFFKLSHQSINIYNRTRPLGNNYAIDHFIPWAFVGHNELWNLAPIDSSTNSQKSDKLPDPDLFLQPLAQLHYAALQQNGDFLLQADGLLKKGSVALPPTLKPGSIKQAAESLKDGLRQDLKTLLSMKESQFCGLIDNTIRPLYQQASNLHFQTWNAALSSEELQPAAPPI